MKIKEGYSWSIENIFGLTTIFGPTKQGKIGKTFFEKHFILKQAEHYCAANTLLMGIIWFYFPSLTSQAS
jgi:hypothetical protein